MFISFEIEDKKKLRGLFFLSSWSNYMLRFASFLKEVSRDRRGA